MLKRLKSWARTSVKLSLLVLSYFWIGAAYKLVYAQTHDLSRIQRRVPISYYQQHFLIDSLLHQTWMFGPAFRDYLGEMPPLAALMSANPQSVLADYCRTREAALTALPGRYPHSLFVEEALDDAYLYSQGASLLGIIGARQQPRQLMADQRADGAWRTTARPDFAASTAVALRLANDYPDSPQAARGLQRVADAENQQGNQPRSRALYRRLTREYPRSEEAEAAANSLFNAAIAEGRLEEARLYKRRALAAAERVARERFAGRALPAASTVHILGYRLDLSNLDLRLARIPPARDMLSLAEAEIGRLRSLPDLEDPVERELRDAREKLDRGRSELWVADLFDGLQVGVPGPPPRAREYTVSGEVRLGNRPLSGIQVILGEPRMGIRALGPPRGYHSITVTDRRGRFEVPAIPAGTYRAAVVYPTHPAGSGGAPVLPEPREQNGFPRDIEVKDRDLRLPPIRFRRALLARSFGELGDAAGVRLEWDPWPGATSYAVRVSSAPELSRMFERRVPENERRAFRRRPVLWTKEGLKETSAVCPLPPLAPDQAITISVATYQFQVEARDAGGKVLNASIPALNRFNLSPSARQALNELRPRRPSRGAGARPAPDRGPRRRTEAPR